MIDSKRVTSLSALLALVSHTSAQVANVCPSNDVCFKLNIPEVTASSGSGDIFFQISGPSRYEWIALGQGRGMAGSNIFAIYTSGDGNNVTLSPRLGTGNQMPRFNEAAQVSLLEGSGVTNGVMTANIRCSNCNSWSGGTADFTAGTGNWIYAYQSSNGPKNNNDQSATIRQHSGRGVFAWNYANAKGGNSINPLVNVAASSSSSSSSSSSRTASAAATATATNSAGTSDSGFTAIGSETTSNRTKMLIAHGVLAALAFVVLFPAGAIAMRLSSFRSAVMLHAVFQIFAFVVYIAGFGLGVYLATEMDLLDHYHPIIGILVLALIFFQPFLGLLHHLSFKKTQSRTLLSYAHIWLGRIAVTLGIINGGLGLKLADSMGTSSKGGIIAYGVVAGIVWVVWVATMFIRGEKGAANNRADGLPKFAESPRGSGSGVIDASAPVDQHGTSKHEAPVVDRT